MNPDPSTFVVTGPDPTQVLDRLQLADLQCEACREASTRTGSPWTCSACGAPPVLTRNVEHYGLAVGADARGTLAVMTSPSADEVPDLKAQLKASGFAPWNLKRLDMLTWDPLESTCRHASLSIL